MEALHNKVRVFCARTKLDDFFKPYDKLGLKRIAPENALRAMDTAGLHLDAAEHAELASLFVDEHGLFDFGRFVTDYNDVPPTGFYERNPDATLTASRASSFSVSPLDGGSAGYFVALTETEQALFLDILARVAGKVAERGIVVKQFLKDFDEHRKGTVTASRFKRELTNSFGAFLRPAEVELIAKAYLTADRSEVRYMVFHNDVTAANGVAENRSAGSISSPPSPERLGVGASGSLRLDLASITGGGGGGADASAPPEGLVFATRRKPAPEGLMEFGNLPADDIEAIEAAVVRQVFERRIKLWDCFCDWDKMRVGELQRGHFRRGMRLANIDGLSPACIETLADKYAIASDPTLQTIGWTDFVQEVERAFVEHGLEKDPTKRNNSFAYSVVTSPHPRSVRPQLAPAAQAALERALEQTKASLKRLRITMLKAPLNDYDRCGEGMVTETQFLRVLAMFNLVPATKEERLALIDFYRGKGSRAHMVNYRSFLEEVMPPESGAGH